ncbi:hypothetical protein ACSV5M_21390 [Cellvibrio sp. ARAG 10.3]|uniref:hypothetical protein n=1 Tax=Cellvibrio sp. ARAG 10.3 TaxID=3451358 RepID=UPI003F47003C
MNSFFKSTIGGRFAMCCLFAMGMIVSLAFPINADAQPPLPNVLPEGVDPNESDPVNLFVMIGQYFVGFLLWIGVLYLAVKVIWEAIGDVRDAKNGDTKWIAAGKSIAGGIFFFLLVLALALWITNQFLI